MAQAQPLFKRGAASNQGDGGNEGIWHTEAMSQGTALRVRQRNTRTLSPACLAADILELQHEPPNNEDTPVFSAL